MNDTIRQIIKSGTYPPVLLMFGEEDFLLEEDYDALMAAILKDDSCAYDFETLDGDLVSPERIVQSCSTYPFVSPVRVVVVNHFEKVFSGATTKKGQEKSPMARYLESPVQTTLLIVKSSDESLKGFGTAKPADQKTGKKGKTAKFPYNLIFEKHSFVEYARIYESAIPRWIEQRVRSQGKSIDSDAVEFLSAHVNPNIRMINNEIEKLLIHIQDKESVSLDEVKFITGASREYNVFELQNAVGQRNLGRSIEILRNMLAADRQEMLIMTMLARYFIVLYKLLEKPQDMHDKYAIAAYLGVSPFFIQDYISASHKYSVEEIENAFIVMTDTDETLKSSSTDTLSVLQGMLVGIMAK